MSDVTFTMDQIRREAFRLLAETQTMRDEKYSHYAVGVIDLVQQLSELAGENVKDSCLDKSEGAGPK